MNDSTIFDKTIAGDEAIREKTRLVQRNLRLVLVLVNGIADVASLKRSLGDPAMVESALAELERLGLIESEEACAKRLADKEFAGSTAVAVEERPLIEAQTVFDEETAIQVRQLPAAPPPEPEKSRGRPSPLAAIPNWIEGLRTSRARAQEEALYERAYGREAEDAEFADPVSIDPSMAPPLPSSSPRLKRGTVVKAVLALLLLVVVATTVLYPYENYKPDFERRMTAMLDAPVKIGDLKVTLLPPTIVLDSVSVGVPPFAEARAIRLSPAPAFLLSGSSFRKAEVDRLKLQEAALANVGRWFAPSSMTDIAVDRIEFADATAVVGGHALDKLAGEIRPSEGLGRVVLTAAEGKLSIEASPTAGGVKLDATALGWRTPFQPELDLTRFDLHGELTPGRLEITKMEGLLYDGVAVGTGRLVWSGAAASLSASLDVQHLAAARFLAGLGSGLVLDGDAGGHLDIVSRAQSVDRLDSAARIDGEFKIAHGTLRLDLVEAMRSKAPVRGGQMRFETFSGALSGDGDRLRLGNLKLNSGFLRGSGQGTVDRASGSLSGAIRLEMRSGTEGTQANLVLEGSTVTPVLRHSR